MVDVLTDPFVVAEGVRVISNTGIMHKRKEFGVKVVGYLVCLLLVVLHHGRMLTNNASIYSGVSSYLISHMVGWIRAAGPDTELTKRDYMGFGGSQKLDYCKKYIVMTWILICL